MIRNLTRCPYCGGCEVALDDSFAVVPDPDGAARPCPHLAWVEGRYSQFDQSPQGVDHLIGSTEFRWHPPGPNMAARAEELLLYLKELTLQGPRWAFAPPVPFVLQTLTADRKRSGEDGEVHTLWDVDGWAIFAHSPGAFWGSLPECQSRMRKSLQVAEQGT